MREAGGRAGEVRVLGMMSRRCSPTRKSSGSGAGPGSGARLAAVAFGDDGADGD